VCTDGEEEEVTTTASTIEAVTAAPKAPVPAPACTMAEVMTVGSAADKTSAVVGLVDSNPPCGQCLMCCASAKDEVSCGLDCAAPVAASAGASCDASCEFNATVWAAVYFALEEVPSLDPAGVKKVLDDRFTANITAFALQLLEAPKNACRRPKDEDKDEIFIGVLLPTLASYGGNGSVSGSENSDPNLLKLLNATVDAFVDEVNVPGGLFRGQEKVICLILNDGGTTTSHDGPLTALMSATEQKAKYKESKTLAGFVGPTNTEASKWVAGLRMPMIGMCFEPHNKFHLSARTV
jgi:hypothetical protein